MGKCLVGLGLDPNRITVIVIEHNVQNLGGRADVIDDVIVGPAGRIPQTRKVGRVTERAGVFSYQQ